MRRNSAQGHVTLGRGGMALGGLALRTRVMWAANGRSSRTKPFSRNAGWSWLTRSSSAVGIVCGPTQTMRLWRQYFAASIGSAKALPRTRRPAALAFTGSLSPRKANVRWIESSAVARPPASRWTSFAHWPSARAVSGGGQRAKKSLNPRRDACASVRPARARWRRRISRARRRSAPSRGGRGSARASSACRAG